MKAVVIIEPGKVVLQEMEKPVPKPDEALLKLLYGGICGSDLSTYRGAGAYVTYPRIPGHEFSAEIVEIGENELGLKPGMIVTCNPYFNCGECYSCRRGLVNCCMDNKTMGVQREGALAEYITMPISRIYAANSLDAKTLALLEPFCISSHGVTRANVVKGDKVLIIGAGTIGILAALSAKAKGASVYVTDISSQKLDYASNLGVDGTILNNPEEMQKALANITCADGFDVTIEAVGTPSTFQLAIDTAAFGGRVVLIGVSKENLDFNFTTIQRKELNVYGSRNAFKSDFLELIELVKEQKLPLDKIITNTYSLNDVEKMFADFDANASKMLKVVLDFTV